MPAGLVDLATTTTEHRTAAAMPGHCAGREMGQPAGCQSAGDAGRSHRQPIGSPAPEDRTGFAAFRIRGSCCHRPSAFCCRTASLFR